MFDVRKGEHGEVVFSDPRAEVASKHCREKLGPGHFWFDGDRLMGGCVGPFEKLPRRKDDDNVLRVDWLALLKKRGGVR